MSEFLKHGLMLRFEIGLKIKAFMKNELNPMMGEQIFPPAISDSPNQLCRLPEAARIDFENA